MPPQQLPPTYGPQPSFPQQPGQASGQTVKRGINGLLIPLIIVSVLLVGSIGFGVWAFMERDTYKNKTDVIVTREVEIAKKQVSDQKDKEFTESYKQPLRPYVGPAAYGSVTLSYPKTWGAYVAEASGAAGNIPVDGYFHPDFVPGLQSGKQYALRVRVINQAYDQALKKYDAAIKAGKLKAAPYVAPKVANITGMRLEGELEQGKQGVLIVLPLRDKTVEIGTETKDFIKDLETLILPSFTFIP